MVNAITGYLGSSICLSSVFPPSESSGSGYGSKSSWYPFCCCWVPSAWYLSWGFGLRIGPRLGLALRRSSRFKSNRWVRQDVHTFAFSFLVHCEYFSVGSGVSVTRKRHCQAVLHDVTLDRMAPRLP